MTEQASTFDLTHSPDAHRKLLMWTAAAVAIPSAGALLWWLSEKGYNSLTPYKASNVNLQLRQALCAVIEVFDAILIF